MMETKPNSKSFFDYGLAIPHEFFKNTPVEIPLIEYQPKWKTKIK